MKTMTGITWGDDHIYTLVTREFPEEGDEPITSTETLVPIQIALMPEDTETKINVSIDQAATTE